MDESIGGFASRQPVADPSALGAGQVQPISKNTGYQGASGPAQQIGGVATSGVAGSNFTQPGAGAADLGEFLTKAMAPAIERRKKELFFEGFTEAQSGKALGELVDNHSPLTRVFGPSAFQQGAEFFATQDAISKWQNTQLAQMDQLKRLPPDQLAKHMSASYDQFLTGDPHADAAIHQGLLEAQGTLIQTVAKERYGWLQNEAVVNQGNAQRSTAESYQAVMAQNAALGSKADAAVMRDATARMVDMFRKPAGMDDDSYKKYLAGAYRDNLTNGNLYAVRAMEESGVLDLLPEDQRSRLAEQYERSQAAVSRKALSNPTILNQLIELDAAVAQDEMTGGKQISAAEVVKRYAGINEQIKAMTGSREDVFTPEAIRAGAGRVMSAIVARFKHDESRAEAIEDREYNRQTTIMARQAEAQQRADIAKVAWGTGQVVSMVASGQASAGDFDALALDDFSRGDFSNMTRAYTASGFKSEGVASMLQASVAATIGDKYSKAADQSYSTWKKMNQANGAMAQAYYGPYYTAFSNFDRAVSAGIDKEVAFRDAFAGPGKYDPQSIPPDRRKGFDAALKTEIARHDRSWMNPFTWSNGNLTEATRNEIGRALSDTFANLANNSSRPTEELLQQAFNVATGNGTLELYGSLGWSNPRPGPTLAQLLHQQPQHAADIVQSAVQDALNRVGKHDLDGVRVIRHGNDLTAEYLVDGIAHYAPVPFSALKQRTLAPHRTPQSRDYTASTAAHL